MKKKRNEKPRFRKQGQVSQYVRRVHRRTNALPTDRQTNEQSLLLMCAHKNERKKSNADHWQRTKPPNSLNLFPSDLVSAYNLAMESAEKDKDKKIAELQQIIRAQQEEIARLRANISASEIPASPMAVSEPRVSLTVVMIE